jgi:hypothetical protein
MFVDKLDECENVQMTSNGQVRRSLPSTTPCSRAIVDQSEGGESVAQVEKPPAAPGPEQRGQRGAHRRGGAVYGTNPIARWKRLCPFKLMSIVDSRHQLDSYRSRSIARADPGPATRAPAEGRKEADRRTSARQELSTEQTQLPGGIAFTNLNLCQSCIRVTRWIQAVPARLLGHSVDR